MLIVSYATESYRHHQVKLDRDCRDYAIPYRDFDDTWFHATAFYKQHRDVADQRRWAGFGIFKAYIILEALNQADTVIYLDATSGIKEDPRSFIGRVETIHTPRTVWYNRQFCKRDAYVYMGCDEPKFWDAPQVWSGSVIVTQTGRRIIEEWLKYNSDRRVVDLGPSECGLPEIQGFGETRGDQSVLSILAEKYKTFFSTTTEGLPFYDRTGVHV